MLSEQGVFQVGRHRQFAVPRGFAGGDSVRNSPQLERVQVLGSWVEFTSQAVGLRPSQSCYGGTVTATPGSSYLVLWTQWEN